MSEKLRPGRNKKFAVGIYFVRWGRLYRINDIDISKAFYLVENCSTGFQDWIPAENLQLQREEVKIIGHVGNSTS